MSEVTRVLDAMQQGDAKAAEELLPLVYEELRHLAAAKMAREAAGHTLQPTALVHEAWLTNEEVAQPLGVTARTVERYWSFAKVWLFRAMRREG